MIENLKIVMVLAWGCFLFVALFNASEYLLRFSCFSFSPSASASSPYVMGVVLERKCVATPVRWHLSYRDQTMILLNFLIYPASCLWHQIGQPILPESCRSFTVHCFSKLMPPERKTTELAYLTKLTNPDSYAGRIFFSFILILLLLLRNRIWYK